MFVIGFVIAFTIIGIRRVNAYLNNNNPNNNRDCQYNTGNSEDDEALKGCVKKLKLKEKNFLSNS